MVGQQSWGVFITGGLVAADLGKSYYHATKVLFGKADLIIIDEAQSWPLVHIVAVLKIWLSTGFSYSLVMNDNPFPLLMTASCRLLSNGWGSTPWG